MTWIKKQADGTHEEFNFVAPEGKTAEEVLFPLGDVQEPAYAAILNVDVDQMETFVRPGMLTGNIEINLNIHPQVSKGAKLHLKLECDDTNRDINLGAGFDPDFTDIRPLGVSANSYFFQSFVYDGTAFVPMS